MSELEHYVSVDIETAGPNPGLYSLLSIGACLVADPTRGFYVELKPVNGSWTPEAKRVHGLDMESLAAEGETPEEAMGAFEAWLNQSVPAGAPIFVAFNAPFDWMFVNDYFHRYLGRNPFGHSALDIKSYAMGRLGIPWRETSMAQIAERVRSPMTLTHNALQDARDQAELFRLLVSNGGVLFG